MPKYNHLYSLCFSVISDDANGDDVTVEMLRAALKTRICGLDRDPITGSNYEWLEACNNERDSYEIDDDLVK